MNSSELHDHVIALSNDFLVCQRSALWVALQPKHQVKNIEAAIVTMKKSPIIYEDVLNEVYCSTNYIWLYYIPKQRKACTVSETDV